MRELREEAGVSLEPSQILTSNWRQSATFKYRGTRRINYQCVRRTARIHQRRPFIQCHHELSCKAHVLRHHPTLSEERLWSELRGGRLGVPFRRQVVIGRYIADFVCRQRRLVVEVDGEVHQRRERLDALRDEQLQRAGYRVLRLSAALVASNLPAAVDLVRAALA